MVHLLRKALLTVGLASLLIVNVVRAQDPNVEKRDPRLVAGEDSDLKARDPRVFQARDPRIFQGEDSDLKARDPRIFQGEDSDLKARDPRIFWAGLKARDDEDAEDRQRRLLWSRNIVHCIGDKCSEGNIQARDGKNWDVNGDPTVNEAESRVFWGENGIQARELKDDLAKRDPRLFLRDSATPGPGHDQENLAIEKRHAPPPRNNVEDIEKRHAPPPRNNVEDIEKRHAPPPRNNVEDIEKRDPSPPPERKFAEDIEKRNPSLAPPERKF
ncbi:hypothetical protein HDU87_000659, partial [Geranomyces variabilis]